MNFEVDGVAIAVFCALFLLVTVLGFVAARWKRGDLAQLDEWGLGGRRFGTVITWFLLGGDLFTAYTFIAVPALVWAIGAGGFFALPYTVLVFPLAFLVMPRLWSVASKHRYVTAADFVKGATRAAGSPPRLRSPACSPRCPTSRFSWWGSRWCSRAWASKASGR
jgi:solute:Na+ symporter, SSS family